MPVLIGCPSCGVTLSVTEELLGRAVRCASCSNTFLAESISEPSPTVDPEPQEQRGIADSRRLSKAPPSAAPSEEASGRRGSNYCPECDAEVHTDARYCPECDAPLEEKAPSRRYRDLDEPRRQQRGLRRDCEPHRGSMILVFGILSDSCALLGVLMVCCISVFASVFPLAGVVLGVLGVMMGTADIKEMDKGLKDPEGRAMTNAGWICSLVGLILCGLYLLVVFVVLLIILVFLLIEWSQGRGI